MGFVVESNRNSVRLDLPEERGTARWWLSDEDSCRSVTEAQFFESKEVGDRVIVTGYAQISEVEFALLTNHLLDIHDGCEPRPIDE